MQYLLLIYGNEKRWNGATPQDITAEIEKYNAFGQEFGRSIKAGDALQPTMTAKTVRVRDGKTAVSDGPFAETKEQLGGYYLIEADTPEAAAAMAAKVPAAQSGCVEVRPIQKFS